MESLIAGIAPNEQTVPLHPHGLFYSRRYPSTSINFYLLRLRKREQKVVALDSC